MRQGNNKTKQTDLDLVILCVCVMAGQDTTFFWYARNVAGVPSGYLECSWCFFWVCQECSWCFFWVRQECSWCFFWVRQECSWCFFWVCQECSWCFFWVRQECSWCFFWVRQECSWCSRPVFLFTSLSCFGGRWQGCTAQSWFLKYQQQVYIYVCAAECRTHLWLMKAFSWGNFIYIYLLPGGPCTLQSCRLCVIKRDRLVFFFFSPCSSWQHMGKLKQWCDSPLPPPIYMCFFWFVFWLYTVWLCEWAGHWRHKAISCFPLCSVQFLSSRVQLPLTLTGSQYADNLCRVKEQAPHIWGTESWDLWLFLRHPLQWKDGRNTQDVKISSGLVMWTVFLLIHMKSFFIIDSHENYVFFKNCVGLYNDEHVWVWSWPKSERLAFSQSLKSRSFMVFVLIDTANSFVHSLASNQVMFSFGCFWFWWAFADLAIFLPFQRLWKFSFSSFACW